MSEEKSPQLIEVQPEDSHKEKVGRLRRTVLNAII